MTSLRSAAIVLVLFSGSCLRAREEEPEAKPSVLGVYGLTCEHRVDPLGIDALPPRLSWKLATRDEGVRGLRQSAYQVLVARDEARLAAARADLWDSGQVESDETVDVEYGGLPLESGTRCAWKVRVWDQDGVASEWSPVARFSIGILEPGDWRAQWIGFDAPSRRRPVESVFDGAKWIWSGADPEPPPAGERFFRAHFALAGEVASARLALTADNQWEVFVNGNEVHASDGGEYAWRRPADADVAALLFKGDNVIAVRARNDAPGVAGLLARLRAELADGTRLELVSDASWSVGAAELPEWTTVGFDDRAWAPARELAAYGAEPWGRLEKAQLFLPPPRLLRKSFAARAEPVRATLYASALGLVELQVDGPRVGSG